MIYQSIEELGLSEQNDSPDSPQKTVEPIKFISNSPNAPTIIKTPLGEKNTKYIVIFNVMFSSEDTIIELLDCYYNAIAGDKFDVIMNTPGGQVPTLMNIIEAMGVSKAKTKVTVYGIAASCGALYWLHADEQDMMPGSQVMFHSSAQFLCGKSLDIIDDSVATVEYVRAMMAPAVEKGFLTEEEFLEMFKLKKNIWLSYDEFIKRTTAPPVTDGEPAEGEGGEEDV